MALFKLSIRSVLMLFLTLISFTSTTNSEEVLLIPTINAAGQTIYLPDNRKPALYTGNFGDCLGSSAVNVTRFDAAYYQDNMTVLFHLEGDTSYQNSSVMS